jgi:acetoin utilization deacetylase AcuC-like enzyme
MSFRPGSGTSEETGEGAGAGTNINLPLPAGSGRAAYLAALDRVVLPALARLRPNLILVACGLDASMNDAHGAHEPDQRVLCADDRAGQAGRRLAMRQAIGACHEGGGRTMKRGCNGLWSRNPSGGSAPAQ